MKDLKIERTDTSTAVVNTPRADPNDLFMTTEQLNELITKGDYQRAQSIMDLQDRLAARRIKDEKIAIEARSAFMLMENHKRAKEEERAFQAQCERNGHVRPDRSVAISGQKLGNSYFLICCRCSKNFYGIGDEANQLPRHIANQMDFSMVGG